ncbi:MAG: glycosyltransferase [Phenylobacterium sp.]|uniref:glycosyltransferase family 2 protein n=1 Tax=Phenylobacterium sp. TaxID=1871053 RepID=UPI00273243A1|nr:glycosyltransferase [Phenylobacterium sp.]MDP3174862.1 glycosyltransferase [Phenylobacterium sp.]
MSVESPTPEPAVTIVVIQRDRFSLAKASLDSLYENTGEPFRLIYVTGGAPRAIRRWLDAEAGRRGFEHIAQDRFLAPNEARNLGVSRSQTPFVALVENDVMFSPGWLGAMTECAEATGAAIVAPLTCQGVPLHQQVHHLGGDFVDLAAFNQTPFGERDFNEHIVLQGELLASVAGELERTQTQFCEFHCCLVRRSIFEAIGPLDASVISVKEYLDFSLSTLQAGGSIWFEPKAVVTHLYPSRRHPLRLYDLPYFILRWSREWEDQSIDRLQQKWGLRDGGFVTLRRSLMDWRLPDGVLRPLLARAPVLGRRHGFRERGTRLLYPPLKRLASAIARRYERDRQAAAGR